jgi:hypothetical protein
MIRTQKLEPAPIFEVFSEPLIGLPVSHMWQGYGSAVFLEFGKLQRHLRRDGSTGNPRGEWSLSMIEGWRIEGKRRIWCGSWSDRARWPRAFTRIQGQVVKSITLFGRLPEVDLVLANGVHLVSFMTSESDPDWLLSRRRDLDSISVEVCAGRLRWNESIADENS